MKKFFLIFVAILATTALALPAYADSSVTVNRQTVVMDFPNKMTFSLDASSPNDITDVTLIVRFGTVSHRLKAKITPAKEIKTQIEWNLGSQYSGTNGGYLPPGTTFDYSWIIQDSSGNQLETEPISYMVIDNRISWQVVENDALAVHWYGAPKSYGQSVFDAGVAILETLRKQLGATNTNKVQVWLYTDRNDFRSSIPDLDTWVGGQSYGEYNSTVLLVSVDDLQDAVDGVRHELTHQVVYEGLGNGVARTAFPHWLNEGLATFNQFNGQGLPNYMSQPLQNAIRTDSLPSLRSRASNFPPDSNEALLSYAMSYSIVDMIFKQFGEPKMAQAFELMKEGHDADYAFTQAFGVNTDGLDNMWRKSIGLPERDYSKSGIPSLSAQPTYALSSAETPSASLMATPTPPQISAANTPAPVAPTASQNSSNNSNGGNASTGLCGVFGAVALAMFGAYEWRARARKRNRI